MKTDVEFHDKYRSYSMQTGSTAVIVLIVGDRIICANVGDSRAVLSRNKIPLLLSKDHKPVNSK